MTDEIDDLRQLVVVMRELGIAEVATPSGYRLILGMEPKLPVLDRVEKKPLSESEYRGAQYRLLFPRGLPEFDR